MWTVQVTDRVFWKKSKQQCLETGTDSWDAVQQFQTLSGRAGMEGRVNGSVLTCHLDLQVKYMVLI